MNQAISDYFDQINQEWQAEVCRQIHQIIQQAVPQVEERIQYGKPHYLKNGKYACVLGTAKSWVSLTIFNAQLLETPQGLFEASGNGDRKTLKIRQGDPVDERLLSRLIQQSASSL